MFHLDAPPKPEALSEKAVQLPPWGEIVAFSNGFLEATNERLNSAACQFDVVEKINEFRSTFRDIISTSNEIRGHMAELTQHGLTSDQISDGLGVIFNDILGHLKNTFPPSDQAPCYEWQEMMNTVLDMAEQALVDFSRKHGMPKDRRRKLRSFFARLKQLVKKLVAIMCTPPPAAACIVVGI